MLTPQTCTDTPEEEAELTATPGLGKCVGKKGYRREDRHRQAGLSPRAGTRVVACFNYTGTPYIGQTVLPEVV